jgi:hypothetical protein
MFASPGPLLREISRPPVSSTTGGSNVRNSTANIMTIEEGGGGWTLAGEIREENQI